MRRFSTDVGGVSRNFFAYMCERASPYIAEILRVKMVAVSKGNLTISAAYQSSLSGNDHPECMHGGVIASMIDHAGGFACWSTLQMPGSLISTVDLSVEFISPLYIAEKGISDSL
jgi:acyl-coenzyme A thioesterase PaaI-like protein